MSFVKPWLKVRMGQIFYLKGLYHCVIFSAISQEKFEDTKCEIRRIIHYSGQKKKDKQ
jgi:hypothetical protein